MRKYKVKVEINQTEYYEVEAQSEQGALDDYIEGEHLFKKFHGDDVSVTEEIDANANLIASAPDLLSACKYALGVLESIPEVYAEQIADILDESIDTNRLESVIAKAEGK